MIRQLVEELEAEASPDAVRTLALIARGATDAAPDALGWLIDYGFGTDGDTGDVVGTRIDRMTDADIEAHVARRVK